jgi:squalene-hopene/tetraprenyl-beta-curcumene cyclase
VANIQLKRRSKSGVALVTALVLCVSGTALVAQQKQNQTPQTGVSVGSSLGQSVSRAVAFLAQAQADDGSFSKHPGITAIVTTSLLRNGRTANDPVVAKSLKYLETHVREDGGIYREGSTHKNYETCTAMVAFQEANKDGRYKDVIAKAEKFVKDQQWDDGEGHASESPNFGGAGYGSQSRPDLSNTSFLVDALHTLGRGADDPAMQKALLFISRCQNLESPQNTTQFAAKVNDGGFYYTIAAGGSSFAGQTPDGGLRSYGSMTYAGLKSMIYAGVTKDDPRVKAAHEWVKKNYTVKENPGMGEQGLYYYYHTFAKALDAIGDEKLAAADGASHDWRAELAQQLASTQKADGSWVNGTTRWQEGDPNLVTAYSLLALSYCQPKDGGTPPADRVLPDVPQSSR